MNNDHAENVSLLADTIVRKKKFLNHKINLEDVLFAEQNRVLFSLSEKTKELKKIEEEGDLWIDKLKQTILFSERILSKIPHVTTRTYKYLPYITYDIDLFVENDDFIKAIDLFKKAGCQIKSHDPTILSHISGRIKNQQKNVCKKGLLTIDLHRDFTWQKRKFLDRTLLFKNIRRRKIAGVKVDVPSPEVEFILCLADVGHERFNFTLLDLIWLEGLSHEIKDWSIIFAQANKYGWLRVCRYVVSLVNAYSQKYYNKAIVPDVAQLKVKGDLPFFLPLNVCWLSYWENLLYTRSFPFLSFAYMHYAKIRYYLSGKRRMPYYSKWYSKNYRWEK